MNSFLEQGGVDQELAFELSMDHVDPFLQYIERIKTGLPPGANIVGSLLARMQALWDAAGLGEMAERMFEAPGDRSLNYGTDNIPARVGLGLPIAYDIWYLFDAGNVLGFGGKTVPETMAKMADYFTEIDNAKPLLSPESKPTAGSYNLSGGGGNGVSFDTFGSKEYTVKEARYEVMETSGGANYGSVGPKQNIGGYVGYIAFPVGPLGVMWGISMASESALSSSSGGCVKPIDYENATVQGGELLPPFDVNRGEVAGEKLMSKGYLVENDARVEILASDFGGMDNPALHYWLRYWITQDNTEIVPGEFVGMLCRPWPLHCWWFQETAPFLYSGHWVETEFYTSGIVKEVIEPEDDELGNRYKVWVKNEEITVKSTDFYEYEVGERVGLLKTWREGEETGSSGSVGTELDAGGTVNFNWQDLELLNTGAALTEEWVIVPAGFYGSGNMAQGA